jgi:cytochrome P450
MVSIRPICIAALGALLAAPAAAATLFEAPGSFFTVGPTAGQSFGFVDGTADGIDVALLVDGLAGPAEALLATMIVTGRGAPLLLDGVSATTGVLPPLPDTEKDGRFDVTFEGGPLGAITARVSFAFDDAPDAGFGTASVPFWARIPRPSPCRPPCPSSRSASEQSRRHDAAPEPAARLARRTARRLRPPFPDLDGPTGKRAGKPSMAWASRMARRACGSTVSRATWRMAGGEPPAERSPTRRRLRLVASSAMAPAPSALDRPAVRSASTPEGPTPARRRRSFCPPLRPACGIRAEGERPRGRYHGRRVPTHRSPDMTAKADLSHIPGPPPSPVVGHTLRIVRDAYGLQKRSIARYGPVYKVRLLGVWRVNLCGADAMEMVLLDKRQNFSSEGGWHALSRLFPGGLMLQDFAEHRRNRRIMQAAFRASALRDYLRQMAVAMEELVGDWPVGAPFPFYDAIKELTLRTGCAVFMGLPTDHPLARKLNAAFIAEIRASLSVIRRPVPFTPMWRGVRGRAFLRDTFRGLIAERRAAPGEDFFSQMCLATDEDGTGWSEDEILDQFNFLMMAAHDTTSTAITTMIWALGTYPEWQDVLAGEVAQIGDGPLDPDVLAGMTQTEQVFREALRLVPPVPFIPREAIEGFSWQGFDIPAGTAITLNPGITMLSPEFYTDPERFDPSRFSPNRAEDRAHKFAWTPFGGGAHKCIGMHFSTLQAKTFVATLLRRHRVKLAGRSATEWQRMPTPRPKDRLPVILEPAAA